MVIKQKVTLADLEKLTGISYKTIVKRLADIAPVEKTNKEIFYNSASALPLLFGRNKEDLNLIQEKARWTKIQADKGLIELEKLQEDTVDKHIFMKGWIEKVVACRSKLLSVALQTSGEIATCDDVDTIYRIIHQKIEEALLEIGS